MSGISYYYINLDNARERRSHIETMWRESKIPLKINRFSAIKPDFTLGQLSAGETGCILSHLTIWEENTVFDDYLVILEDDAIICKDFHANITELINSQDDNWDIIFLTHTEPINEIQRMSKLLMLNNSFRHSDNTHKFFVLEANEWYLYGTVGYILNKSSVLKTYTSIANMINEKIYLPIDNLICKSARQGAIRCKLVFPYLVGIRTDLESQINRKARNDYDLLHGILINLYFIDRDIHQLSKWAQETYESGLENLEAKVISQVYSSFLSKSSINNSKSKE